MRIQPRLILGVFAASCLLAITASARRLSNAKETAVSSLTTKTEVERDADTVLALRQQKARVELQEKPKQDVIAQVNAVLAEAGIPSDRFQGLEREGNENAAGSRTKRQSLRLTLDRLTPPDLGRFLGKWRASQPVWTVTRIELLNDKKDVADPNRYTAHLLLSTTYVTDGFPAGAK